MIDENILVLERTTLFPDQPIQGFLPIADFSHYEQHITSNKKFLPRAAAETDPTHKQIIPYLVFCCNERFFVMQRKSTASETRLKNKYTLGIGGHIRQEDMTQQSLIDWATREFNEEVNYNGKFSITPLGIINDESDPVGQVHTGFVYLLQGDSENISIKSELKQGSLQSLQELKTVYDNMESWSQYVVDYLSATWRSCASRRLYEPPQHERK